MYRSRSSCSAWKSKEDDSELSGEGFGGGLRAGLVTGLGTALSGSKSGKDRCCLFRIESETGWFFTWGLLLYRLILALLLTLLAFDSVKDRLIFLGFLPSKLMSASARASASGSDGSKSFLKESSTGSDRRIGSRLDVFSF